MRAPAWCPYSVSLHVQEDYSNYAIWVGIAGLWTFTVLYKNFEYALKWGLEHETFISHLFAITSKAVNAIFSHQLINNLLPQNGTAPRGKVKGGQYYPLVNG